MPQSFINIYIHIVFSTKFRKPFLRDRAFRDRVHAYMAGIADNLRCPALRVGGIADHVHLLCRLASTIKIASLLRELKRDSSKWIKSENPELSAFRWQNGYGAFSVSRTHVEVVRRYISNQEQHHRRKTFKVEFRTICKQNNVDIDERYAWD